MFCSYILLHFQDSMNAFQMYAVPGPEGSIFRRRVVRARERAYRTQPVQPPPHSTFHHREISPASCSTECRTPHHNRRQRQGTGTPEAEHLPKRSRPSHEIRSPAIESPGRTSSPNSPHWPHARSAPFIAPVAQMLPSTAFSATASARPFVAPIAPMLPVSRRELNASPVQVFAASQPPQLVHESHLATPLRALPQSASPSNVSGIIRSPASQPMPLPFDEGDGPNGWNSYLLGNSVVQVQAPSNNERECSMLRVLFVEDRAD